MCVIALCSSHVFSHSSLLRLRAIPGRQFASCTNTAHSPLRFSLEIMNVFAFRIYTSSLVLLASLNSLLLLPLPENKRLTYASLPISRTTTYRYAFLTVTSSSLDTCQPKTNSSYVMQITSDRLSEPAQKASS